VVYAGRKYPGHHAQGGEGDARRQARRQEQQGPLRGKSRQRDRQGEGTNANEHPAQDAPQHVGKGHLQGRHGVYEHVVYVALTLGVEEARGGVAVGGRDDAQQDQAGQDKLQ
jgi:hypothetical protein